jgi:hypothetical protein
MGKATAPRAPKHSRSKAGCPRQQGDRYRSGKLRPPKPNDKVLAIIQAFGLEKHGQKFIEVAFHRGWIDEETYWASARYAALYRLVSPAAEPRQSAARPSHVRAPRAIPAPAGEPAPGSSGLRSADCRSPCHCRCPSGARGAARRSPWRPER